MKKVIDNGYDSPKCIYIDNGGFYPKIIIDKKVG